MEISGIFPRFAVNKLILPVIAIFFALFRVTSYFNKFHPFNKACIQVFMTLHDRRLKVSSSKMKEGNYFKNIYSHAVSLDHINEHTIFNRL
jgi:hypothetical protein